MARNSDSPITPEGLAAGFNGLGAAIVQDLWRSDDTPHSGNIVVSGLSMGLALLMTYWGARGKTAAEMAQILGIDTVSNSLDAAKKLMADLGASAPDLVLHLANALWVQQGYSLQPGFVAQCADSLGATIEALAFSEPRSAERINGWVCDETQGAIDKLIPDQIHPLTVLFLTNVLVFRAKWAVPFVLDETRDEPFDCWDGERRQVAMMHRTGRMLYAEDENSQAVGLPFLGDRILLEIVLPQERDGLTELAASINKDVFEAISARLRRRPGSLAMPRLQISCAWHMGVALRHLGMQQAFDASRADFRGMSEHALLEGLHVSRVMHNTMFEVDESGAEAAAATAVEMRLRSLSPPEPPFDMVIDHPFAFCLRDRATGAALMQGTIGDPSVKAT